MKALRKLFPGGKKKALTLSYDDGVEQDKRLIGILNKYGIKGTFNLNSGIQNENSCWTGKDGKIIRRINIQEISELYKGHEVAVHGLTHPFLDRLPGDAVLYEVLEDKKNLEAIFGYPVRGMAYPYGTYNNEVMDIMRMLGIEYSRTVNQHGSFKLPESYLEWDPTCHHSNPELMNLAKKFTESGFDTMVLFYVWGHSYEFYEQDNWELIEQFCSFISNKNDIWYATNIQIIDYLKALKRLVFSSDCSIVYNPSALYAWISVEGVPLEVKPGQILKLP